MQFSCSLLVSFAFLSRLDLVVAGAPFHTESICATYYGPTKVRPTSTGYQVMISATCTKTVEVTATKTVTPLPVTTTTSTTSTTTTTTETDRPTPTETITETQTSTETETEQSAASTTTTTTTTTTETSTSTSTVPTAAGFTPLGSSDGPPSKERAIEAAAQEDVLAVRGKQARRPERVRVVDGRLQYYPQVYPTKTVCATVIKSTTTATVTKTAKTTATTTRAPVTSTDTETITDTTTTIIVEAPQTATTTTTATTTSTTTQVSTTTFTNTATSTQTLTVPGPTVYAACQPNNVVRHLPRGYLHGFGDGFATVPAGSAEECCAACQRQTASGPYCAGYVYVGFDSCYITPENTCNPASFFNNFVILDNPDLGDIAAGNSGCGQLAQM